MLEYLTTGDLTWSIEGKLGITMRAHVKWKKFGLAEGRKKGTNQQKHTQSLKLWRGKLFHFIIE